MGPGRERTALIKSLITRDRKDTLEAFLQKIELNLSADKLHWPLLTDDRYSVGTLSCKDFNVDLFWVVCKQGDPLCKNIILS